jgi:putative ABC transport system permease protein
MIRHAFTLVWNRKRANALIMLELMVTFLVLFALAGFSLNLYRLYDRPLGFDVANKWSITTAGARVFAAADSTTYHQLMDIAAGQQEVAAVELMYDLPFDFGGSSTLVTVGNLQRRRVSMTVASPKLPQALGVTLLEGRWFGPQDESQRAAQETINPVLVNRAFRDAAGGNVVGKLFANGPNAQHRIVGVFDEFRQRGQFSATGPVMIQRLRVDGTFFEAPRMVLILKPGVPADFEERLLTAFQRAAPGWDFDVDSWESLQDMHFRLYTIPLMIGGGLVLFLLVMVGFGLLGVLWQNVIRRTAEMGLRRAMGATAGAVRAQVVLEVLAVALLAIALAVAVAVQLPLSGILPALDWNLFVPATLLSTVLLLALCTLFALYPSYQATRQDPVEALRHE